MRIVQTCDEPKKPTPIYCKNILIGTVFKCKGGTGTWVKCIGGYFNLTTNNFYPNGSFNDDVEVDLTYPNARIVLE